MVMNPRQIKYMGRRIDEDNFHLGRLVSDAVRPSQIMSHIDAAWTLSLERQRRGKLLNIKNQPCYPT